MKQETFLKAFEVIGMIVMVLVTFWILSRGYAMKYLPYGDGIEYTDEY